MNGFPTVATALAVRVNGVVRKKIRQLVHAVMVKAVREGGIKILNGEPNPDALNVIHGGTPLNRGPSAAAPGEDGMPAGR